MEATKPNPGLDFLICPTADQRFEFEKRLQQARDTAARVSTSTLTTADAWLGLITRALPRITYALCLTRFTKKKLKQLSIAIDNAFLPKLTINRNTPRIILARCSKEGSVGSISSQLN
jgi:hypothetical protein